MKAAGVEMNPEVSYPVADVSWKADGELTSQMLQGLYKKMQ
jgi:hypothetical protein